MNTLISIGSWAFAFGPFESQPWSFSKVLQYAQKAGYDGVEVNGFLPHPVPELYNTHAKRKALIDEIKSYGLKVSAYAPDFRKTPPAIVAKADYLELFKRYVDFSNELGTSLIRVDSVTSPKGIKLSHYEDSFARITDTWHDAAEIAASSGLRIVWEFEPGFWLNKPSEVVRAVKTVGHPAFRVLFDTCHAYMCAVVGARHQGGIETLGGGILEFATQLKGQIGHYHFVDSDGTLHDEETSTHTALGAGLIDFATFNKEVRSKDPTWDSLEWCCVDYCFNEEAEEWGRQAIPFIRNLWREAEA